MISMKTSSLITRLRRIRRKVNTTSMQIFLIISMGAILGANCRYWLGGWAVQRFGAAFPYGNLIINLSGSFLLGLFMALVMDRFLVVPQWRLFVAIGFLGSYTTFSSYTYESVNLMLSGQYGAGLLNLFGSSFLGGIAVLLGIWLGRLV
jgi:fluoride exporter